MVTVSLYWAVVGVIWSSAGAFFWALANGVGYRIRAIGGRLVYIPDRDSDAYTAAVEVWKQKMAA